MRVTNEYGINPVRGKKSPISVAIESSDLDIQKFNISMELYEQRRINEHHKMIH